MPQNTSNVIKIYLSSRNYKINKDTIDEYAIETKPFDDSNRFVTIKITTPNLCDLLSNLRKKIEICSILKFNKSNIGTYNPCQFLIDVFSNISDASQLIQTIVNVYYSDMKESKNYIAVLRVSITAKDKNAWRYLPPLPGSCRNFYTNMIKEICTANEDDSHSEMVIEYLNYLNDNLVSVNEKLSSQQCDIIIDCLMYTVSNDCLKTMQLILKSDVIKQVTINLKPFLLAVELRKFEYADELVPYVNMKATSIYPQYCTDKECPIKKFPVLSHKSIVYLFDLINQDKFEMNLDDIENIAIECCLCYSHDARELFVYLLTYFPLVFTKRTLVLIEERRHRRHENTERVNFCIREVNNIIEENKRCKKIR